MQLELRRLVALNPNVQFAIKRLFSEGNFLAVIETKNLHTSFTIWLVYDSQLLTTGMGKKTVPIYTFLQRV